MRRAAKVDDNQKEIVAIVRSMGCSVQHLHMVGKGCPDLLIGVNGKNLVWELKDGSKPPSQQKLTTDEELWHLQWSGSVQVVNSIDQAINIIKEESRYDNRRA